MRKILINDELEKEVEEFCVNLFTTTRNANFIHPLIKLKKLHSDLKSNKNKKFRNYISKIIGQYDRIIRADPDDMVKLNEEFFKIDSGILLNQKVPNKNYKFYEAIVHAMRYEDLRNKEFLTVLKTSKIKTCVYCNSQLTVVIDYSFYDRAKMTKVRSRKGKLELDHFYPKSKHPYLSTSYYNLYPVCGNCNKSKSYNSSLFELYTRTANLDVFNFWIDDASIIKYWLTFNHDDLHVNFEQIDGNISLLNNHNSLFGIQGIYDTQKDVAEELVHKAQAYSNAYKKNLVKSFTALFPDKKLINRLLIGNYDKPEDVHKRPMAKYIQDIARQLKLI